ncbi:MAG: sulfur carrier protein ThiS [Acidobacteriaceae bacterium]|nr:sulfur carrier protein ThiS [Acidobacteriaceae bacterium]
MTVYVNGHAQNIPPNQSIATLIESLDVPSDRVAVELNRSIVRKRD